MVLPDRAQAIISALPVVILLIAYLRRFAASRRWLAITLSVCLADQATKAVIQRYAWLSEGPLLRLTFLGGWLHTTYVENPGLGFGASPAPLLTATVVLAATLVLLYWRLGRREYRMSPLVEIGCALVLGGLLGILLDRIRLGCVVDFIGIGRRDYSPCNLADLAALAGGFLFVLAAARAAVIRGTHTAPTREAVASHTASAKRLHRVRTPALLIFTAAVLAFLWTVVADPDAGLPALHKAAYRGRVSSVSRLLARGADPSLYDRHGLTPLHYAAMGGHTEVAERLLASGADVNAREGKVGFTPLDRAILGRSGTEMVGLLLRNGADLNRNSLYHAVTSKDVRVVEMLLAHGAEINPEKRTTSVLWAACFSHNAEVMKLLIAAGADVNARNRDGSAPLHRAASASDPELVSLLLSAGADVNAKDGSGKTPLHTCGGLAPGLGGKSPRAVASLLVARGADVSARSADGITPLIRAVLKQDLGWVKLLLSAGAEENQPGPKGQTPLHYAAAKGNPSIASALLSAGADVDTRNGSGKTPADLATSADMKELLRRRSLK